MLRNQYFTSDFKDMYDTLTMETKASWEKQHLAQ